MALKRKQKNIEKVTCIAYYLNHKRDMKKFKKEDLIKLKTEEEQKKYNT